MKVLQLVLGLGFVAVLASARPSDHGSDGRRLIKFSEASPPIWLSVKEVEEVQAQHINFMDITVHPDHTILQSPPQTLAIPTTLRYRTQVQAAINRLSQSRMQDFLTTFSSFHTRYYSSATGVESSNWLLAQVRSVIASSGYPGQVSASQFTHTWAQSSVIARIQGSDPNSNEVVVIGAHQDSINGGGVNRSPGVDDDGSGSTCIFEAFRALLESGFVPKTTVEFQWYAAEEVGLWGSQAIAQAYKAQGKSVVMTQFDMVGYLSAQRRIGFVTDFTNAELNAFLRKVVDGYLTYTWMNRTCGYACSDHASWTREGYPAAFPFEDSSSPYIHTASDTLATINFNHVHEFAKLAVGYVIEVAEPRS